ncbi:hypothetical protein N8500_04855 [Candidatus Puniceispirillum sp.]|nr:hypothetical protein [Candidatus Puniceispirillum sp.]
MKNSAIKDADESVGQLADGEVARLLSVLQNAEFTKSKTHNLEQDTSFKPRTLIEIAAAAQERKAKVPAQGQADFGTIKPSEVDAAVAESEAGTPLISEVIAQDLAVNKELEDQGSKIRSMTSSSANDVIEDSSPEIRGMTSNSIVDNDVVMQAVNEPLNENADFDPQVAANFETVDVAFERGKAEGIADGRQAASVEIKEAAKTDARAELEVAVKAFNEAVSSLLKPQALQAETLSKSIHKTILGLASERAGKHIDDMPEAFSDRIESLVISIGQKMMDGSVQLNPDDYEVMAPYLSASEFDLSINTTLMRGDVVLRFDGVELHDIAENRIGSHYTRPVESEPLVEDSSNTSQQPEIVINALQADQTESESVNIAASETAMFEDNIVAPSIQDGAVKDTPINDTIEEEGSALRGMTSSAVSDDLENSESGLRGMTSSPVTDDLENLDSGLRGMTSSPVTDDLEELSSGLRGMTSSAVSDEIDSEQSDEQLSDRPSKDQNL